MCGFYNIVWEVKWAGLPEKTLKEIQKIYLILNHEYLKQVLCNKGTFCTRNTYSQPKNVMWRSDAESTTYGSILFIDICPV